jgi:hypothetical protein
MQLIYKNKLRLSTLYVLTYFIADPYSYSYTNNTEHVAGKSEPIAMIKVSANPATYSAKNKDAESNISFHAFILT